MVAVVIKQRNAAVMEMEMIITQFMRLFLVCDIFHFISRYFADKLCVLEIVQDLLIFFLTSAVKGTKSRALPFAFFDPFLLRPRFR